MFSCTFVRNFLVQKRCLPLFTYPALSPFEHMTDLLLHVLTYYIRMLYITILNKCHDNIPKAMEVMKLTETHSQKNKKGFWDLC